MKPPVKLNPKDGKPAKPGEKAKTETKPKVTENKCKVDDEFPFISGGEKQEYVYCTIFDKINDQIVVVGHSQSSNFNNFYNSYSQKGIFAYAIDFKGKYSWGYSLKQLD